MHLETEIYLWQEKSMDVRLPLSEVLIKPLTWGPRVRRNKEGLLSCITDILCPNEVSKDVNT